VRINADWSRPGACRGARTLGPHKILREKIEQSNDNVKPDFKDFWILRIEATGYIPSGIILEETIIYS
jgi:hypothetical protein